MKALFHPIDGATLVFFRIFAGLLMTWELVNSLVFGDWHEYTSPLFHFNYLFLPWLSPLPPAGMAAIFSITIAAGIFVSLGLFYRVSSVLLFLGYTSIFLMEASEYINHLYFYSLLAFWMMWMPLNQEFSLDVWAGRRQRKTTLPAWMLVIILFHVSAAYFFAGVAKLGADWLNGTVPTIFMRGRGFENPLLPVLMTYGGLLFDLFITPFLLIRKTRAAAFICALIFHVTNVYLFGLVTFPWMMILLTTLFFPPSWPRKILNKKDYSPREPFSVQPVFTSLLILYMSLQTMIPLRHHLHGKDPSWTEEGHQFSWRMKTRTKSGTIRFTVIDGKGAVYPVNLKNFLTDKQIDDMTGKPDLILQFAHFLRDSHAMEKRKVKVFVSSRVSLNGREARELIKSGVDLAQQERSIYPYKWVND